MEIRKNKGHLRHLISWWLANGCEVDSTAVVICDVHYIKLNISKLTAI
jgi:hypothetical protein